jgi:hypothetical protein
VFVPVAADAENFGELIRAAAAGPAVGLPGRAIGSGCRRLADQ